MRVLFVYSGNTLNKISTVVSNQMESLRKYGLQIDGYPIIGKGIIGYLRNVKDIRNLIKKGNYSIIHAHYSLSGFIAGLAKYKTPLVVSLMGSDTNMNLLFRILTKFFNHFFWDFTIIKSSAMNKGLGLKQFAIIPNGVDLEKFSPVDKLTACEKVSFAPDKINIIFPSNPTRPEKNFRLAKKSIDKLNSPNVNFQVIHNIEKDEVRYLLSAADIILVSSFWEGSPNIVKEAMACGLPVVSTDVGDVKWLFGNIDGYFIASFDVEGYSKKIAAAISFVHKCGRTQGRNRLADLCLDAKDVALKLKNLYEELL